MICSRHESSNRLTLLYEPRKSIDSALHRGGTPVPHLDQTAAPQPLGLPLGERGDFGDCVGSLPWWTVAFATLRGDNTGDFWREGVGAVFLGEPFGDPASSESATPTVFWDNPFGEPFGNPGSLKRGDLPPTSVSSSMIAPGGAIASKARPIRVGSWSLPPFGLRGLPAL